MSMGDKFRQALKEEQPLQIIGTINAYCALMAEESGFRAIYLSGAGMANMSYGLPDLGVTRLEQVLEEVSRIARVSSLPLLVDIDTGWEAAEGVSHAVDALINAGVAAIHIEDQVAEKRCGHRPHKTLVSTEAMCDRLSAAVAGRGQDTCYLMARTDAVANEGIDAAIARAQAYVAAGADAIFAEALTDIDDYKVFCQQVNAPILANITEFGKTPLYALETLGEAGVAMVLYPLSAARAMNQAAMEVYHTIRKTGTQESLIAQMQDRETLYKILDYHAAEERQ